MQEQTASSPAEPQYSVGVTKQAELTTHGYSHPNHHVHNNTHYHRPALDSAA